MRDDPFNLAAAVERLERSTEILEGVRGYLNPYVFDPAFDVALRQTIQINRWWLKQRKGECAND